jgi:hypothetical protein
MGLSFTDVPSLAPSGAGVQPNMTSNSRPPSQFRRRGLRSRAPVVEGHWRHYGGAAVAQFWRWPHRNFLTPERTAPPLWGFVRAESF